MRMGISATAKILVGLFIIVGTSADASMIGDEVTASMTMNAAPGVNLCLPNNTAIVNSMPNSPEFTNCGANNADISLSEGPPRIVLLLSGMEITGNGFKIDITDIEWCAVAPAMRPGIRHRQL